MAKPNKETFLCIERAFNSQHLVRRQNSKKNDKPPKIRQDNAPDNCESTLINVKNVLNSKLIICFQNSRLF